MVGREADVPLLDDCLAAEKKEARGINDADFGEVQLTIGDTVIAEKGVTDKKRFYLPKSLIDNQISIFTS